MDNWTFGVAVATARRMQGLRQAELAAVLNHHNPRNAWTQSKVSRLERDVTEPTVVDLVDLATIQGMPYQWYLDGPSPTTKSDSVSSSYSHVASR